MREKGSVVILLPVLLIIIAASGAYYLGALRATPPPKPPPPISASPSPGPNNAKQEDNYENLVIGKFYVNTLMGFSLSYPSEINPIERNNEIIFGNLMRAYVIKGQNQYWGCAIPTNTCPVNEGVYINGSKVFKRTGRENSIGGKDLLEYEFRGYDPRDETYSDLNELNLFFEYIGDPDDMTNIKLFNKIMLSVKYLYGVLPGPRSGVINE